MYEAPAIEADPIRVRKVFDTNVFGLFDMVQAFIPLLLQASNTGSTPPTIINTSSIVSRVPFLFAANYNASKAAITSYSDTLRLELAPLGIKVVTLFMGEVSTGLMSPEDISFRRDSLYIDIENRVRERSRQHVLKSMKPEEFARLVVKEVRAKNEVGKGEYLWKGTQAMLVWFLDSVGWRKIFDKIIEAAVGLDRKEVRKAIFDKGKRSLERE